MYLPISVGDILLIVSVFWLLGEVDGWAIE